jgi:hypothetical protein
MIGARLLAKIGLVINDDKGLLTAVGIATRCGDQVAAAVITILTGMVRT